MEPVTPQDLFERYCALSDKDRIAFLHLVGAISTATHPLTIVSHLSETERLRYTRLLHDSIIADFEPVMFQAARETAKAMPEAADADFDQALRVRVEQLLVRVADQMRALADEEIKKSRDRKSGPGIIRRNVEICDQRKQDSEFWSYGQLAKRHHLSSSSIRDILAEESRWRQLEARLDEP